MHSLASPNIVAWGTVFSGQRQLYSGFGADIVMESVAPLLIHSALTLR